MMIQIMFHTDLTNTVLLCMLSILLGVAAQSSSLPAKIAYGSLSVSGRTVNFGQILLQNYGPQIEMKLASDINALLNMTGNSTFAFFETNVDSGNLTKITSRFHVLFTVAATAALTISWQDQLKQAVMQPNVLPSLSILCQGAMKSPAPTPVYLVGSPEVIFIQLGLPGGGCGPFSCFAVAMCVIFGLIVFGIIVLCYCMLKKRKQDAENPNAAPALPSVQRGRGVSFTDALLSKKAQADDTEAPAFSGRGGSVRSKSRRRSSTLGLSAYDDEPFTYEPPAEMKKMEDPLADDNFDPLGPLSPTKAKEVPAASSPKMGRNGTVAKVKFELDAPPPDVDDDWESWGKGSAGPRFA
jgi:hypothetical protein